MFPTVITLMGIEQYWNEHNSSLFENVAIPDGVDHETMVAFIISRAGDFSVLDFDPEYMKRKTALWFEANLDEFTKWYKTITAEYDPIYDYYRKEDEFHADHDAGVINKSATNTRTNSNTSTGTGSSDTENKTSAFNSATYSADTKSETDTSDTTTSSGSETIVGSSSDYDTKNRNGEYHKEIKGRNGNIQQAIRDELKLREEFSIYDMISTCYIREFCIPIYG